MFKAEDEEVLETIEVLIFAEGDCGYLAMYNDKMITIDPFTTDYMDYDTEWSYPEKKIVTGIRNNEYRFLVVSSTTLESEVD